MRVFRDMDLVEQLGSGVPRILQSYGQECFYFSENFTRMSFPMDEEAQKTVVETVVETVGETAREIMEILKINPNFTSEAIAKQLKISIRGVEYNLNKLKKLGIIRREGATKNGKWLVI